jgi:hypothetical protein
MNALKCGITTILLLIATSLAMAQAPAPAAAAKPAGSSSSKQNLDEDIKLLRKNVRAEKSRVMLNALGLSADQTQKFLPIYKEYEGQLGKLNDLRQANIQEYANNYTNLTDTKADELVNQAFSYYKKRADLLASYYDKVRAALGTGTAARFVQVEAMLLNLIDLQIQSNMPLVWTPSSP